MKPIEETKKGQAMEKVVRQMPPLFMKHPGQEEYTNANNEVMQWLAKQPEALQVLIDIAHYNCWIVFDKDTHQWHGAAQQESQAIKNRQLLQATGKTASQWSRWNQELVNAYQTRCAQSDKDWISTTDLAKELGTTNNAINRRMKCLSKFSKRNFHGKNYYRLKKAGD